jgi:secretion/DNA translocation related CpaE-like protein
MPISTVAVCCDDLGLMSDARRLCAAAGLDVEVTGDHDARRWWPSSVAVLLDPEAARLIQAQGLPRRAGVAVLTRVDAPDVWRTAVEIGAEQVAVVPFDEHALLGGVLAVHEANGGATVVACLPATGGAGASTVAAGLALASARLGSATLLIDADPAGGGLDLIFGLEHAAGVRWPDLLGAAGTAPPEGVPDGLLRPVPDLALLSWDRRDHAAADTLGSWCALLPAARSSADLVVVDLPGAGAAPAAPGADVVVLVVRAGVRQTVAAASLAARLRPRCPDLRLVVRGAGRGGLAAADIAEAVGVPLVAQLAEDRRIPAATDDGQLPRLLTRLPLEALAADLCPKRSAA